jgi:hypothetical protein
VLYPRRLGFAFAGQPRRLSLREFRLRDRYDLFCEIPTAQS